MMARLLVLLLFASSLIAQNPTAPEAVIYKERPEGGPMAKTGRDVPSSGGVTIHALDINSSVGVEIVPETLAAALAEAGIGDTTPQQKALLARIVTLKQILEQIQAAVEENKKVVQLFHSGSVDDFIDHRSSVSRKVRASRNALQQVIADQLVSTGVPRAEAETRASRRIGALGIDLQEDWEKLAALVSEQITIAEDEYRATSPNLGVALEIQAYLVPRQGDPIAIALPGYNTIEPGPLSRYEKVKFEIPSEQRQLFEGFQQLASEAKETKSAGAALLVALRSDFALSPFQKQLDKIGADAKRVRTLVSAINENTIERWLETVAAQAAQGNPADKKVIADLTSLVNESKQAKSVFTQVTEIGKFAAEIRSARDPVAALDGVLTQLKSATTAVDDLKTLATGWKNFITDAEAVKNSLSVAGVTSTLKASLLAPESPFAPILAPDGALETVKEDVERFAEMVESLRASETGAIGVGNLPVPEGQMRRDIGGPMQTSFNLQTIPGTRAPGDNVRVSYAFYRGEQQLTEPKWTDVFGVRVFGLQDKAVASLALVRRISEEKFTPTAAMSWLLSYERWPKTADDRVTEGAKIFSGFGLTTMTLDFDPDETVELGAALTMGLLRDRILLGYGWNLQAEKERSFAFFSIHLLSRSGFLANAGN